METERLLSSLHTPRPADQRNEGRVGIALLVDRRHGILLVSHKVHKLTGSNILVMPIMTIQLSTGEVIYRANFFLHSTNEVEFLEVFEEYIFIKQREHRLVVFSVLSPFFHLLQDAEEQNRESGEQGRVGCQAHRLPQLSKHLPRVFPLLHRYLQLPPQENQLVSNPSSLHRRLPKNCKYADNTYDNIAFISVNQDILVCYYCDKIRTGKVDIFDLITGDHMFSRDSRSVYPSDNYALEDVSGIMYDFQGDILYTGKVATDHQ